MREDALIAGMLAGVFIGSGEISMLGISVVGSSKCGFASLAGTFVLSGAIGGLRRLVFFESMEVGLGAAS
jgi:hypothetical protein